MKRVLLSIFLLASIFVLAACGKKTTDSTITTPTDTTANEVVQTLVQDASTVWVYYVWALENGEIFDTNIVEKAQEAWTYNELREYNPLVFTVGKWQMIPWFEKGVIGMKLWETKTLNIAAVDGYGEIREDMVQTVDVATFEEAEIDWTTWQVGEKYTFDTLQWTILEITEDTVTIDFNHFLAWKDLVFTVTVEEVTN